MAKSRSLEDELKQWKNKYFDLREDFDAETKDAEAFRSVLQRMLLRLCLSAEGQSTRFDQELDQLRTDVRRSDISVDELVSRLNSLDEALARIDSLKEDTANTFKKLISDMVSELEALKPPREQKRALRKLAKSMGRETLKTERFVPLLKEFSRLQSQTLNWLGASLPKPQGLMSRLFGGNGEESQAGGVRHEDDEGIVPGQGAAAAEEAQTHSSDELEIEAGIETGGESEAEEVVPGFSAISVQVRATMNHLLEQLTFPQSSERALKALRDKISKPLNWYELGPTLDDLSNVIISAIGKGQRDFGSFLTDIDGRLQKIQNVVLDALRLDESLRDEEKLLDKEVRQQISNMTTSLNDAKDVESLKRSIKEQVDSISSVLDRFSENTQKLEESKAQELEAMKVRFKELEEESNFFRQRLKEERSKALTDALTQLPNREAFDERFSMEYERWKRYRKPATLIVADVDHFKAINDNYGHLSGDRVLQILAKELQARLRKTDFIARYGGEEFVLILPETEVDVALQVMNKTRETISRLPFHFRDEKLQVTVSFGLVAFAEGLEQEDLFECADKALYQAKDKGRNRLEVWGEG